MNKWEKEVQQSLLGSEAEAIKALERQYKKALADINRKVRDFQAEIELLDEAMNQDGVDDATRALLQSQKRSKVYQQQYQKALKGQVSGILDKMQGDNYSAIESYLKESYETGYVGTMYDIAGQGIPIITPIDQAAAVKAILVDSKVSNGLYTRLGVEVAGLKKTITQEISRGIASGLSYADIARNIANVSAAPISRTKTITRTEGHRIQQTSTADAQQAAKAKGADVVKQWDASLDGKTRDSHRRVDGEIRELDEKFSNGLMFPGDPSGPAGEVINCRCTSNTRARWALDEEELEILRERAEYFGLDKAKNFEDFKEKYLSAAKKVVENSGNGSTMKVKFSESNFRSFTTGEEANDFFYYDSEKRGLLAKKNSQHGKWTSALEQDQRIAIGEYCADGYADINNYWRRYGDWEHINTDKVLRQTSLIDKAIADYNLKESIKVYRAVQPEAFEDYWDDIQRLVGTTYTDPAFMSTSPYNGSSAVNKDCIMELFIPAGKGRGAYINNLSGFQDLEYEFLLARDSRFQVISAEETEEKLILKMELITDD